jgi:hypothetical protein
MPSWEQIVSDVCVNGRPQRLSDAAAVWKVVFANAQTVADAIRDSSRRLEPVWTGKAGDDYRHHLETVAQSIEQIHHDNEPVIHMLEKTSGDLGGAQARMPIPDHMLDQVYYKRHELESANSTYGGIALAAGTVALAPVALPMWAGIGGGSVFGGGHFWNSLVGGAGNLTRETLGALWDKFDDHTKEAEGVYEDVNGQYGATSLQTPQPTYTKGHVSANNDYPGLGGGGGGGSAGGVGGLHGGAPKLGTTGISPTGTDGLGGVGGYQPDDQLGTGLSGAGGVGPTGLGSGGPGLGGGGLGGASGLGGAGGGGMAGVGKPVLGDALAGMGGGAPMGAAGGRGAGGGRGGRGSGRGAGMMGGGQGGHGAGDGDERTTWLTEDEDVWGNRTDIPPGVIGSGPDR